MGNLHKVLTPQLLIKLLNENKYEVPILHLFRKTVFVS